MMQPGVIAAANCRFWNIVAALLYPLRHALDGKISAGQPEKHQVKRTRSQGALGSLRVNFILDFDLYFT
jgi:hypothetical protein